MVQSDITYVNYGIRIINVWFANIYSPDRDLTHDENFNSNKPSKCTNWPANYCTSYNSTDAWILRIRDPPCNATKCSSVNTQRIKHHW